MNTKWTLENLGPCAVAVASALLVGACGGGGGSSSTALQQRAGTLGAIPISGVSYVTATQSGVTDANGGFNYEPGETVTFSLGSLELGRVEGAERVTLFDLAGVEQAPTNEKDFVSTMWNEAANRPGPMNTVTNLAALLQGLDLDTNLANGIEIPEGISELITPTINLQDQFATFQVGGNGRDARGTHGLLRAAVNEGILAARPLPAPGLALQRLYDQNQIEFTYWQPTLYTQEDGNGNVTWAHASSYTLDGKIEQNEFDSPYDGSPDYTTSYTYNENLSPLSYTVDYGIDGTPDYVTEYTYDDFDTRIASESRDVNGDITRWDEQEFDIDGNLIRITNNQLEQTWIVDAQGQRSTAEIDRDKDGNIDERVVVTYASPDSRGDRWIRAEYDYDLDGNYDALRLRTFDQATGQLLTDERDDDLDGNFEYTQYQTLTDIGLVASYQSDRDGDGNFDAERYSTYNAAGKLVEQRFTNGGGGLSVNRYTYNTANQVERIERFANESDTDPSYINIFTYNGNGDLATFATDDGGDGSVDTLLSYAYNPNGALEEITRDEGNDGIIESVQRYSGWENTGLSGYF